MGFIDFTNGEVLTADQMDTVMRQSVMKFADAAARDTALSAVLAEGMMAYLEDTNEVLKYDGSQWIDISGDITGVTAGTALTGGGTSGNVTLDVDETALTIAQSQVTNLTTDLAGKQDDVITTQGDLVIGDASGNPVRLPVGSADQVLTSDGTTVSFQDAGGGALGDWTLIDSGSLPSTLTATFTGLSGFSEYFVLLQDYSASFDSFFFISNFNGVNSNKLTSATHTTTGGRNQTGNLVLGSHNAANVATASIFIKSGDSTNFAYVSTQSGRTGNINSTETIANASGLKSLGGSVFNSFRIDSSENIDNGTYEIYGR